MKNLDELEELKQTLSQYAVIEPKKRKKNIRKKVAEIVTPAIAIGITMAALGAMVTLMTYSDVTDYDIEQSMPQSSITLSEVSKTEEYLLDTAISEPESKNFNEIINSLDSEALSILKNLLIITTIGGAFAFALDRFSQTNHKVTNKNDEQTPNSEIKKELKI